MDSCELVWDLVTIDAFAIALPLIAVPQRVVSQPVVQLQVSQPVVQLQLLAKKHVYLVDVVLLEASWDQAQFERREMCRLLQYSAQEWLGAH